MTQEPPEALRLADALTHEWVDGSVSEETASACINLLHSLHAENEALRRDAERYRWLREEANKPSAKITVGIWGAEGNSHCGRIGSSSDDVDTAIDAAMKGQS